MQKAKCKIEEVIRRTAGGLTLIEAVIAMAMLAIVVLGALGYQYYAALHARIARAQIVATRTAQLLLEDWKSTGGSTEYDPYKLKLGFSAKLSVPAHWNDGGGAGTILNGGVYAITTVDNLVPMMVMLRWVDVDFDKISGAAVLRQLSVIINFGTQAALQAGSTVWPANLEPIILTTYVRLGEGSG
ncbi:MAG: prepilin-type N-terminal cleavage/methylation domain-containing protein [Sedimentisphaerales bacterium]|nr:prepilin-type N-terminal cleavage/methylation domain-containing protein [Sedimentisphaerales bacterium]